MKLSLATTSLLRCSPFLLATVVAALAALGGCASRPPPEPVDAHAKTDTTKENVELATTLRRRQLAAEENRLERAEKQADLQALPPSRRRAKEALDRLGPFAAVTENEGGTVVSMPASVLFEGNTAELMTTARERLERVVEALVEVQPRSVVVRGHTDRSGDDRRDVDLSRRRAGAVRQYLVAHGVVADRVRAGGAGSSVPAASNASPEGRHDNRRVEIVVEAMAFTDGVKR